MFARKIEDRGPLERTSRGAFQEQWRAGESTLRMAWTIHGAIRVDIERHGDGRLAAVIIDRLEALNPVSGIVALFDCWTMRSYDAPLRTELTPWFFKNRARVAELHVAFESKIVAMGIAVANVALGGLAQAHSKRASFEAIVVKHDLAHR